MIRPLLRGTAAGASPPTPRHTPRQSPTRDQGADHRVRLSGRPATARVLTWLALRLGSEQPREAFVPATNLSTPSHHARRPQRGEGWRRALFFYRGNGGLESPSCAVLMLHSGRAGQHCRSSAKAVVGRVLNDVRHWNSRCALLKAGGACRLAFASRSSSRADKDSTRSRPDVRSSRRHKLPLLRRRSKGHADTRAGAPFG
jgi:hypothetical protein